MDDGVDHFRISVLRLQLPEFISFQFSFLISMLNKLKDSGSCSKTTPSQKFTHSYDYINSKNFDYEEPTGWLPDHPPASNKLSFCTTCTKKLNKPSEGSIEKKYSITSDDSHINTSFDPSITFNMVSNVLRIPMAVTAFSSLSSPSNSWINVMACVNTNSNAVHHFEMIRVPCKLEGTFIGSLKGRIYVDAFPPPPPNVFTFF